jgi:hypothetical protein
MQLMLATTRAILHQLDPTGIIAPVLFGDVVALTAFRAGQRDMRADCFFSHDLLSLEGRA